MRSISRDRAILGDAALQAFGRSSGRAGSLARQRSRISSRPRQVSRVVGAGGRRPTRHLRRVTAVDLVNYRQHLLRTEPLKAATA
jgi:hypothetical protein